MKRVLTSIAIVFAMWTIISLSNVADPFLFPGPLIFLKALILQFGKKSLYADLLITFKRVLYAFIMPTVVGVPLGVILGAHPNLYRNVELIIDMGKSTVPLAVFPLFLLIFGVGDMSKIMTAGIMSIFVVVFSIGYGVMHTKKTRVLAAQIMGAKRTVILKSVVYFETLPHIFVGLRNGMSWALIVILASEMFVGTFAGLGHRIIDAQISYNIPDMYAVIFITALLGYSINLIFVLIEKRMLHWVGK
jgi:ABC-type nitrate/sulfonate/bicarbonate transport system permease component